MTNAVAMRYVMATLLHVEIRATDEYAAQKACDEAFRVVLQLENVLSAFRPSSDLSTINACAGERPVRVCPDAMKAIQASLAFAQASQGAYDPTIGAVSRAGSTVEGSCTPVIDYRLVEVNETIGHVFLPRHGMKLDLGGVGKGIALDQALAAVQPDPAVTHVRFNFGGHLLFWNRDHSPCERVFVETRGKSLTEAPSFMMTRNGSVSTSSAAEQGRHHFDPRTGSLLPDRPGVTVIAPTAAAADAWSTALYVAGAEESIIALS